MPMFNNTLIGIGKLCYAHCKVTFTKYDVTIYDKQEKPILEGWCEKRRKMWRFALHQKPQANSTESEYMTFHIFSVYDPPTVETLVRQFHTAAGFQVKPTWLNSIKASNYESWPGLT